MEKIKKKNSIVKWAFVPVCLMLVICVFLFNRNTTNINFKPSNPIINKDENYEIYINTIDYNILNNYELWCRNTKNNRKIYIAFSDKYKPIRDYFFEGDGKVSKINNVELTIYKHKNSYITTFTYNNINFDIETNDITEKELIELLISIIKE